MAHESLAWPSNHLELMPAFDSVNLLRQLFDNRYWRVLGEKGQLNKTRVLNSLLPMPAEAFPFWDRVSRAEIDFSRGFLLGETATAKERQRIRRRVSRIVHWQGKQRFSMKITGPGRIEYLSSIFPDACFINVVRDPVATVRSLMAVPFWKDLGMHRLWWQGGYDLAEIACFESLRNDPVAATAFQVGKILQSNEREARRCGAKMLTLGYEAFIADPEGQVREICAFTGLSESPQLQAKLRQTRLHDRNHRSRRTGAGESRKILSIVEQFA